MWLHHSNTMEGRKPSVAVEVLPIRSVKNKATGQHEL